MCNLFILERSQNGYIISLSLKLNLWFNIIPILQMKKNEAQRE